MVLRAAVHIGPLAGVYAISRGLPLLVLWPASHLLLSEPVGPPALAAVAILLGGLFVLTPGNGMSENRTTTSSGYLWAVATAATNTSNSLIYKAALLRGAAALPLVSVAFLLAFPIAASALVERRRGAVSSLAARLSAALRWSWPLALAGACAFAGSFLVALAALRHQGAAWVLTLRNLSIALAPLLVWAAFGERPSRRSWLGVALVACGALALGLG